MEQILFESKVKYTRETMKSFMLAYILNSKTWLLFLLPIAFIGGGILLYFLEESTTALIFGVAIGSTILLFILSTYIKTFKIQYARSLEQNGGEEITIVTQFFEDGMLLLNPLTANKTRYSYDIIKKVFHNKRFVIAVTNTTVLIVVEKSMFTISTPNELVNFLKAKARH